ncbi:hypothetical protein HD554DRAFT_2179393 [Boletus coccyginus]|nr:hypothetical protein HD554DRAFT_2179393 [Boletus coccyginus]
MSSHVSVSANVTRRKALSLPTIRVPRNVYRSPRATSVEYVYDNDDADDEPTRVLFSADDTVAIHPSGELFLNSDGEVPLMSYWFGKITRLFLQPRQRGAGHHVWVEVQWLYRAEDLRTENESFADHMGEYELADSDHLSIVDITCIEQHVNIKRFDERGLSTEAFPSNELYMRWKITVKLKGRPGCDTTLQSARVIDPLICCINNCTIRLYNPRLRQRYCRNCKGWFHQRCIRNLAMDGNDLPPLVERTTTHATTLDQHFLSLIRTPIARGGIHGIAGNGLMMSSIDEVLRYTLRAQHFPHDWREPIEAQKPWPVDNPVEYFACPHCHDSWM